MLLCLLISISNCCFPESSSVTQAYYENDNISTFQPLTDSIANKKLYSGNKLKNKSRLNNFEQTSQLPIWHKIRNGYQLLPKNVPRSVSAFRREYLGRREYLSIVFERSRPFLFYITEQLKLSNMPLELALLPIIESGYDPFAYSSSHAAGLWQFIPSTGEYFGLEKNHWYDGRLDLIHSTRAAIEYLGYLYNHFNHDWLLALAAYNAGEGFIAERIEESLKQGLSGDFWSLDLPRQTSEYVPRLLAIADIIKNPQHYAVPLPNIPNRAFFEIIPLNDQVDVSLIIQKGRLSIKDFSALNAGILESITPPVKQYHLLVPVHQGNLIREFLHEWRKEEWIAPSQYSVVFGDTLSEIAQKHNVTLDSLMRANDRLTDRLWIGETLLIPRNKYFSDNSNEAEKNLRLYRVVAGDSLSTLGRQFGMNVNEIKRINKLENDLIHVGQTLKVRVEKQDSNGLAPRQIFYNIKSGDTLSRIANKYGTTLEQILEWNNISDSQIIHPGQTLIINSE